MATHGITGDIKCPFYSVHRKRLIYCEGIVARARTTSQCFGSLSECRSHIECHCMHVDGAGCEVYKAIMKKYEDK